MSFEPRIESGSIGSRTRARYEREPKKTEGFSIFDWFFFFFFSLFIDFLWLVRHGDRDH